MTKITGQRRRHGADRRRDFGSRSGGGSRQRSTRVGTHTASRSQPATQAGSSGSLNPNRNRHRPQPRRHAGARTGRADAACRSGCREPPSQPAAPAAPRRSAAPASSVRCDPGGSGDSPLRSRGRRRSEFGRRQRRRRPDHARRRFGGRPIGQPVSALDRVRPSRCQAGRRVRPPPRQRCRARPTSMTTGPIRVERMSKIRKTIATQMHASWSTVPRVTNFDDADITDLERLRQSSKEDYAAQGLKLTTMPFLIKAVATALRHHPTINAVIDQENEQLIYKDYVNVGIAVDTDRGLVVPVMQNADRDGDSGNHTRVGRDGGQSSRRQLWDADDLAAAPSRSAIWVRSAVSIRHRSSTFPKLRSCWSVAVASCRS